MIPILNLSILAYDRFEAKLSLIHHEGQNSSKHQIPHRTDIDAEVRCERG